MYFTCIRTRIRSSEPREGQIRFQIQSMGLYLITPLLDCFRLQCLLRLAVMSISPLLLTQELELGKFSFVDHDGQTHAAIII